MTRKYNPKIVEKNVRILDSAKNISAFVYDLRDGEVISCGRYISDEILGQFNLGIVAIADASIERKPNQIRIRKFKRCTSMPEDEEIQRGASNNLLETVLQYNHLQRVKAREQGVNQ